MRTFGADVVGAEVQAAHVPAARAVEQHGAAIGKHIDDGSIFCPVQLNNHSLPAQLTVKEEREQIAVGDGIGLTGCTAALNDRSVLQAVGDEAARSAKAEGVFIASGRYALDIKAVTLREIDAERSGRDGTVFNINVGCRSADGIGRGAVFLIGGVFRVPDADAAQTGALTVQRDKGLCPSGCPDAVIAAEQRALISGILVACRHGRRTAQFHIRRNRERVIKPVDAARQIDDAAGSSPCMVERRLNGRTDIGGTVFRGVHDKQVRNRLRRWATEINGAVGKIVFRHAHAAGARDDLARHADIAELHEAVRFIDNAALNDAVGGDHPPAIVHVDVVQAELAVGDPKVIERAGKPQAPSGNCLDAGLAAVDHEA